MKTITSKAMAKKIEKWQFKFEFAGYGHYRVEYKTKIRHDYWRAIINDMTLIDDTRHEDYPTQAALVRLRGAVKKNGLHYSKSGEEIC